RAGKVLHRAIEVDRDAVVRASDLRRNGLLLAFPEGRDRGFHEHDPEDRLLEDDEEGRMEQHDARERERGGGSRQVEEAARQEHVRLRQRESFLDPPRTWPLRRNRSRCCAGDLGPRESSVQGERGPTENEAAGSEALEVGWCDPSLRTGTKTQCLGPTTDSESLKADVAIAVEWRLRIPLSPLRMSR